MQFIISEDVPRQRFRRVAPADSRKLIKVRESRAKHSSLTVVGALLDGKPTFAPVLASTSVILCAVRLINPACGNRVGSASPPARALTPD